jgi:hypothetical protein
MLGYHRESTYQKEPSNIAEARRRIFWTLYIFDKNTSLLLGRSAKMQDVDIDVEIPVLSNDRGQRPWDKWLLLAIKLAKTQGQIYDLLYSASALQATSTERKLRIDSLIPVMHDWRSDLESVSFTPPIVQTKPDQFNPASSTQHRPSILPLLKLPELIGTSCTIRL